MNIEVQSRRIAYNPEKYSSFPDIVISPSGELLCVYREGECHHPTSSSIILLRSVDGITWEKTEFAHASLQKEGYVFNCPRINIIGSNIKIISDIKTGTKERECLWDILLWNSDDSKKWDNPVSLNINGMVPDKIIQVYNSLLISYHVYTRSRLIQMIAFSDDDGKTWINNRILACSEFHNFCEGSVCKLTDKHLVCYLRDNTKSNRPAHYSHSFNSGKSWLPTTNLNLKAHRIVASVKKRKPLRGKIIGTYRDTYEHSVRLFVHTVHNNNISTFEIEKETFDNLYDFGYTGFVEMENGSLCVVYYIRNNLPNPEIKMATINFIDS